MRSTSRSGYSQCCDWSRRHSRAPQWRLRASDFGLVSGFGFRFSVFLRAPLATLPLLFLLLPRPADGGQVFLRANQLGYRPTDVKVAMAFSRSPLPETFAAQETGNGKVVFTGRCVELKGERWAKFEHHAELDFTGLKQPGHYTLTVGTNRSLPFRVGPDVGWELPGQLLEFMRQQRCGYNPWLHTNCHPLDGRTAYGPREAGSHLDARGGWHDAGDLLKYLITSGNATAQMLLAWQLNAPGAQHNTGGRAAPTPGAAPLFADRVDARGEPGANQIPDILDEARWGLDWLLKLHPSPDELYHQVADDRDHIGFRLPQNEVADYGWGKGGARVVYFADGQPQGLGQYQSASTGVANLAGRSTAAFALAYQIWKDTPAQREFAERCLQAAKEVYALGREKEGAQQGNSVRAPYRYEETTWADDMEWGATELFRATGDRRFLDNARQYAALAGAESWMGREQAGHYQFYPFMNAGHFRLHDLVDSGLQQKLAGWYREGIEACLKAGEKNPYRHGAPFIWCSNNLLTALATQCLLYERMTGDRLYRQFTARQRDWLLGRNPWGYTMFTEIGEVFPTDVHLMTTKLTGRRVCGGLVDGPVYERIFKSLRGVAITEPDPLAAFQDERAMFHNDLQDYSTNEPTMDGTASAILLWSLVATQE